MTNIVVSGGRAPGLLVPDEAEALLAAVDGADVLADRPGVEQGCFSSGHVEADRQDVQPLDELPAS